MDIVAYLGLRELILNLIQRNFFPYSHKQSPWEECLLTVMCFLQESSAMPHPGQGWQQGLVTQCQPWRWCWERSFSLHPRAWYRAHCGDGLCQHGQRWACCKSSSALAPRLCHCLQEPVPGWGHVAHNCPETKPALCFSRESSEREEIGRCYARACWNEFLRSDMTHLRAWWSLCYLFVLLRPYTCIFLTIKFFHHMRK